MGVTFAGQHVDVVYDPACTDVLTIESPLCTPFQIRQIWTHSLNSTRTSSAGGLFLILPKSRRGELCVRRLFEMKKTLFVRSIPVDDLYMDQDTEEIHNRLLYATRRQLFALVIGDPGTGKNNLFAPPEKRPEWTGIRRLVSFRIHATVFLQWAA